MGRGLTWKCKTPPNGGADERYDLTQPRRPDTGRGQSPQQFTRVQAQRVEGPPALGRPGRPAGRARCLRADGPAALRQRAAWGPSRRRRAWPPGAGRGRARCRRVGPPREWPRSPDRPLWAVAGRASGGDGCRSGHRRRPPPRRPPRMRRTSSPTDFRASVVKPGGRAAASCGGGTIRPAAGRRRGLGC